MGGTIVDVPNTVTKRRRRSSHVRFKEEEEIINPGAYVLLLNLWAVLLAGAILRYTHGTAHCFLYYL